MLDVSYFDVLGIGDSTKPELPEVRDLGLPVIKINILCKIHNSYQL